MVQHTSQFLKDRCCSEAAAQCIIYELLFSRPVDPRKSFFMHETCNSDTKRSDLLLYCLYLQDELDEFSNVWNRHSVRPTAGCLQPSGRPNILYNHPALYGDRDYLQPAETADIDICMRECTMRSSCPCDTAVYDIGCYLMQEDCAKDVY